MNNGQWEKLVSDAAEATEVFSEDELERYAAEIRGEICWTCQRFNGIQPLDLAACRASAHEISARK